MLSGTDFLIQIALFIAGILLMWLSWVFYKENKHTKNKSEKYNGEEIIYIIFMSGLACWVFLYFWNHGI